MLLPFKSSGAIHGSVPLTPPDTKVLRLILDKPRSPTCKIKVSYLSSGFSGYNENAIFINIRYATLHIGRCGSLKLTSKFSHLRSKWTMFFECKYSMPKAASIAIIIFFRVSSNLHWHSGVLSLFQIQNTKGKCSE